MPVPLVSHKYGVEKGHTDEGDGETDHRNSGVRKTFFGYESCFKRKLRLDWPEKTSPNGKSSRMLYAGESRISQSLVLHVKNGRGVGLTLCQSEKILFRTQA